MENQQNYMQFLYQQVNQLMSRVRLLEERYDQLSTKIKIVDESSLSRYKEMKEMISDFNADVDELKKLVKELENVVKNIIKELENVAKVQDVKVLERYINLLDPTRYLTKEEAIQLIRKEMGRV
ncbi:hypothetical protein DRN62_00300 [Nanoarchaeota archaeon]|nr:MAG: hypothetical protein DRN62_00300 [Nanoarchaeota archaeon]